MERAVHCVSRKGLGWDETRVLPARAGVCPGAARAVANDGKADWEVGVGFLRVGSGAG